MKLMQSLDGKVKLIQLDPTKVHIVIIDEGIDADRFRMEDGAIWFMPDTKMTIIETDTFETARLEIGG